MRHRLLASTTLTVVVAVLSLGVPLGVVGGRLIAAGATSRLEREADRAATRPATLRRSDQPITTAALAEVAAPGHLLEVRLANGRLIAGGERPDVPTFRVAADGAAGFRSVVAVAPADERTEHRAAVWLAVGVLSAVALAVAVALAGAAVPACARHRSADGRAPVTLPAEAARQVLDVLLDNALAHGAGHTTVTVNAADGWCRLEVEDDGAGVEDDDRERIFARGHSRAGGSGVGLALARDLVRRSGGELLLAGRNRFEALLPAPRP